MSLPPLRKKRGGGVPFFKDWLQEITQSRKAKKEEIESIKQRIIILRSKGLSIKEIINKLSPEYGRDKVFRGLAELGLI